MLYLVSIPSTSTQYPVIASRQGSGTGEWQLCTFSAAMLTCFDPNVLLLFDGATDRAGKCRVCSHLIRSPCPLLAPSFTLLPVPSCACFCFLLLLLDRLGKCIPTCCNCPCPCPCLCMHSAGVPTNTHAPVPCLATSAAVVGTNYYYGQGYITNVVKNIDTAAPDGTTRGHIFLHTIRSCFLFPIVTVNCGLKS